MQNMAARRVTLTKCTRARVEIARGGGPRGSEQASVDQRREALDSGVADGDDERRAERGAVLRQGGVVGRDEQADDERAQDVEQEDPDVHALDRLGDVAPRVLGLAGGDGDDLCADEGEGGLGHDGPPTKELSLCAWNVIELGEDTWIFPVSETETIVVRSAAEVEDYSEDLEGEKVFKFFFVVFLVRMRG